jgi:hypothetical protein
VKTLTIYLENLSPDERRQCFQLAPKAEQGVLDPYSEVMEFWVLVDKARGLLLSTGDAWLDWTRNYSPDPNSPPVRFPSLEGLQVGVALAKAILTF